MHEGSARRADAVIVDFPDPNTFALGKLYTRLFYKRVLAHVTQAGAVVVQATSPLFARACRRRPSRTGSRLRR